MDILNKPITQIGFEDVIAFCKEGHPEGIEIEYKREYPSKGLAKSFSAFSNTRGGVIILGVEVDKKSGVPVNYEGISDDAKQVERAHQDASNVVPLPSYEVHKTDANKEKVFILIRIFEGDKTPYYVQNDSNLWVRTGNITNLIDIATPDWVEILFEKRENAEKSRANYLKIADRIYSEALKREDRRRILLIEEAKKKNDGSEKNYFQKTLGSDVVTFKITIQPYYPRKALATPREILVKREQYAFSSVDGWKFPDYDLEPIPEGILHFEHSWTGSIACQQVYSVGLVYNVSDVLRLNESGKKIVFLSLIAGRLFIVLKAARSFYNLFGYQGMLIGNLELCNLNDTRIKQIVLPNYYSSPEGETLLQEYTWQFELDTRVLNDEKLFIRFFEEQVREIYWHLGIKNISKEVIMKFLEEYGFIVSTPAD